MINADFDEMSAPAELAALDRNVVVMPSADFDAWVKTFDDPSREMPEVLARAARLAEKNS